MADFLSYAMHERDERTVHGDVVMLSAERWGWLVDFIRANYPDQVVSDEICVFVPTEVNGIMFLPTRYRGPDGGAPMPGPVQPASATKDESNGRQDATTTA